MIDGIDSGDFAGLSVVLALWFVIATLGMGALTWRYRGRFRHWPELTVRDKADAILNVSLFGILFNAAYQRVVATYSFAYQEWKLTALTLATAPIYLPATLVFTAGFLWWMCLELFGPGRHRYWWRGIMAAGVALGAAVSWIF